jgi:hypothetical protein
MGSDRASAAAWESTLQRAIRSLRFGAVENLVHDGRVVQVETRVRVRFGDSRPPDDRRRNQHHDAQADRNTGRGATPSEESDG